MEPEFVVFVNYKATVNSINSSLNMEYVNYEITKNYEDEISLSHVFNNNLIKFLKAYNYETTIVLNDWQLSRGLRHFNMDNRDTTINQERADSFKINLLRQTLLRFILVDSFRDKMRENRLISFDLLNKFINQINTKKRPQFVFFHVLLPHSPGLFDENGHSVNSNENFYLGQLKYTNKLLEQTVSNILSVDKNAIIIIQSDHGNRTILEKNNDNNPPYNNIIAVYFSSKYKGKINLYDTITPVNLFRTIVNPVLNLKLKKLEDKIDD